jgi:hypothetical protein
MNAIVKINDNVPAALRAVAVLDNNDELSSGLTGGYGILSIKGAKFRAKAGGEDILITNEEGDPKASLEVILLQANPHISKTYYKESFEEGSAEEPDCFSINGDAPSSRSPFPQAKLCAICPQNKFGSKISDSGKESKACADTRRVAVVPAGDIENEQWGGPMLLRVPTMSLGDMATYGRAMKAKGFPYNTIVTRISFDTDVSYPKLKFKAARPVTDEEAEQIVKHLQSDKLQSILFEAREVTRATADEVSGMPEAPKPQPVSKPKPAPAVDTEFDIPAPKVAKPAASVDEFDAPEPTPKVAKPKAKKAAPKDAPVVAPVSAPDAAASDDLDEQLNSIFADMED